MAVAPFVDCSVNKGSGNCVAPLPFACLFSCYREYIQAIRKWLMEGKEYWQRSMEQD